MPLSVVFWFGEPRVEAGLEDPPALCLADGVSKCADVVIGVIVAKCVPNSVKQVLSVDERNGAFGERLRRQMCLLKK
mgnify:CR=1 FL=1